MFVGHFYLESVGKICSAPSQITHMVKNQLPPSVLRGIKLSMIQSSCRVAPALSGIYANVNTFGSFLWSCYPEGTSASGSVRHSASPVME